MCHCFPAFVLESRIGINLPFCASKGARHGQRDEILEFFYIFIFGFIGEPSGCSYIRNIQHC